MLQELINQITHNILQAVLVVVFSYIGIAGKNIYKKYIDTDTKKIIVRDCVKAIEQIYKDLHGSEKKAQCENYISQLLYEKGLTITEDELDIMIESAVQEMNKDKKKEENTIDFKN